MKTNQIADLRNALAALPADYGRLFTSHAKAHGAVFDRVTLDLGDGVDFDGADFVNAGFIVADRDAAPTTRPQAVADFKPFVYELSAERLAEQFSGDQMKRAEAELREIRAVHEKGPWKPTWESLDRHQAPAWFQDAKLGVMLNWGMHSVPAWDKKRGGAMYPDAYGCAMYVDEVVRAHHVQHWGADFQWDDFIPLFKAESYDPDARVNLFKEAGARYLIPMSKHHDGVAWWDSQWTKRNFVQLGPKKDLLTPLMAAA